MNRWLVYVGALRSIAVALIKLILGTAKVLLFCRALTKQMNGMEWNEWKGVSSK